MSMLSVVQRHDYHGLNKAKQKSNFQNGKSSSPFDEMHSGNEGKVLLLFVVIIDYNFIFIWRHLI